MTTAARLLRLAGAGFSMALRRTVAFRVNLVFDIALSFARVGSALAAVLLVFTRTGSLLGWSMPRWLVLIGTFELITATKSTFVDPNLSGFPEAVRSGRLDEQLLRPAPSLFLASLGMPAPLGLVQGLMGAVVLGLGVASAGQVPSPAGIIAWVFLVGLALVVSWAMGVLLACLAFWAPKLQLDVFYFSAWQLARYPVDIFGRTLRFLLTYVFPMALIGSVPAVALLDGPSLAALVGSFAVTAMVSTAALACWRLGLRRYTGATS